MKFEQIIEIPKPKIDIDKTLADIPTVALFIPGVEEVRESDDGSFEGQLRVKVGPMSILLNGKVDVEQNEQTDEWMLRAKAQDKRIGGGVSSTIIVKVKQLDSGSTELAIVSDVQLIGRLGELGQPLIKRKAAAMINGFAENLKSSFG